MNLTTQLDLTRQGYTYRTTVQTPKARGVVGLLQSQGMEVKAVTGRGGITYLFTRDRK